MSCWPFLFPMPILGLSQEQIPMNIATIYNSTKNRILQHQPNMFYLQLLRKSSETPISIITTGSQSRYVVGYLNQSLVQIMQFPCSPTPSPSCPHPNPPSPQQ